MKKILILLLLATLCTACLKSKNRELKSPCVAIEQIPASGEYIEQTPCVRRPVNVWIG